jgi:hypothetical protein
MVSEKYVLLVGFYQTFREDRDKELLFCLQENIKNRLISELVVFNETDDEPVKSDKITYIKTDKRLTYKQYFEYANKHLEKRRCIISNVDIVISEDIQKLDSIKLEGAFVCLTRWDINGVALEMGADSQDTWIFQSPVNEKLTNSADYDLGVLFSDNVLSLLAYRSGYMPFNPSKDIVTKHVHGSDFRNPSKESVNEALRVTDGSYMLVHPNKMGEKVDVDFMTSSKTYD